MITWNNEEKDALKGRFINPTVSHFILNNTIRRLTYNTKLLLWNTYLFYNSDIDKIINIQNMMIQRALDFQKRSKKLDTQMKIYWFPTEYKKQMPANKKSLDVEEINSACTFHFPENSFIAIYRLEEAPKVLYHELIHYFELDNIIPIDEDQEYIKRFNLRSPCLLRETYCEIMGLLLNIEDISNRQDEDFDKLYKIEYAFSLLQTQKILDFYNIRNENEFHRLISNTNVFTYFILKTAVLLSIKNPVDFLKQMESRYFRLHSIEFLKTNINNGMTFLFRQNVKINNIPYLKNTLRMTIIE
jgi:hypothetical protein